MAARTKKVTITAAVEAALAASPDDVRSGPARELARLLAAKLDGSVLSANETASLARELRQTLAALAASGSSADGWINLLADLGDAE